MNSKKILKEYEKSWFTKSRLNYSSVYFEFQLTECRIIRNGKYTGDPDLRMREEVKKGRQWSGIDSEEDRIENVDKLEALFVINHNKGKVNKKR